MLLLTGLLDKVLQWVDNLNQNRLTLYLFLIAVVWGAWTWIIPRVSAAATHGWKRSRERAETHRLQVSPERKLSLVETLTTETEAKNDIITFGGLLAKEVHRWDAELKKVTREMESAASIRPAPRQGTTDRYMKRLAAGMTKHVDVSKPLAEQFGAAVEKLADNWSTLMYWHDERGTGSAMLDRSTPQSARDLISLGASLRETFGSESDKTKRWVGYNDEIDRAAERNRAILIGLEDAAKRLERVGYQMREFHKQRTGVRGAMRRFTAKLSRP